MSAFIVAISPGMFENWEVCKKHRLWGVRSRGNNWAAITSRIEKGDEIFVWRSGTPNGFIARAIAASSPIYPGQPGFRSPWALSRDFGAVIPIKIKQEVEVPIGDSFTGPRRTGLRFGFNNAHLQHGVGDIPAKLVPAMRQALMEGR